MSVASAAPSILVLVIAAALLIYIAVADLQAFRIRNELVVALAGLFLLYALLSGRWVVVPWHIGFAALMFALMLLTYVRGWMGGGDIKLLAAAFLWTGPTCALPFLLILVIFALFHTLAARLGWVSAQRAGSRIRVAFAPSVAAGLIGVFLIGCLNLP